MISMINIRNYNKINLYDLQTSDEFIIQLKKREEYKENEIPSLVSNTMFKTMFYNTKRLKYSAKFISYYIEISFEDLLKNLKLVKSELDKEYNDTKEERSDYVAEMNGTKINIEVNNNDSKETMERNMEYAFRLYSEKIKIGEDYKDNYNQTIQINLNNFSFKGYDKIEDIFTFQSDDGMVLNNKITIIEIFLPNLRKKCYNQGKESLTEKERYILGLVEQDKDFSKEIGKDMDIVIDYVDEAGNVTKGTNFGEAYDKEWALKDQGKREGIKIGKKEGIQIGKREGIQIGKREGIREITWNLYQNGVDTHLILKSTNLSKEELDDIIKMKTEENTK